MKSAHRTCSADRVRLFARIGALALLVTAQGCGYLAIAVIAATSGGGSSDDRPANVAPTVTISSPVRTRGNIDIDYTLSDPNGDNASITVEHAILPYPGTGVPMPTDWLISTQGGGDPIADLTTSSGGDPHQFIWDAGADLPGGPPYDAAYVRIRITPQDADSPSVLGNVVETANFIAGNNAPSATVQTPAGIQSGLVQIDYTLLDSTDDLVDIAVDFSTDGGLNWAVANNIPVGETANLTSTLAGEGHNFAWDSIADNVDNSSLVKIRITPTDSLTLPGQEIPVETGDFTIQNNTPPIIFISTPVDGSLIGGDVNISYLLLDANDDLVDIFVEYSIDGWVTSSLATEKLGGGSEGTSGLPSSAMGISHLFQWDSALDLPDVDLPNPTSIDPVQIMITPMDPFGPGNSFIATGLQLNNNSEPSVTVSTPSSPQVLGDVTIDYTLFDFDSDIAGIRVEYSTDGGQNFISCSERTGPPSEGTAGLSTSPTGSMHTFVWDTATAQLAGVLADDVVVRIPPSDHADPALGQGAVAWTDVFTVDNTDPPSATISPIASPSMGIILVDYTLSDLEGDLIDVIVEYSTGGPIGPFSPATRDPSRGEGVTGLTSGASHTFAWFTLADLGPALESNVVIRIIPSDSKTGIAADSNVFTVDNNDAPEVQVATPGGVQSGYVLISHTLFDSNSDSISVQVDFEYSLDAGLTYTIPATATECLPAVCNSPASDGIAGLSSAPRPVGTPHLFIWDSIADIGLLTTDNVRVILTPSDSIVGATVQTLDFQVDNGSLVPIVLIDPISRSYPLNVTIPYRILDGDADDATVAAFYSTDGVIFNPMTISSVDVGVITGNTVTAVPTSSSGINHTLVWDSAIDLTPPPEAVLGIEVRLDPSDGDGTGVSDTSNPFTRGNDAPSVTILSPIPLSVVTGLARFEVSVSDSTSDTVDLTVTYDTGLGPVPSQITVGSVSGLSSSPTGVVHTFAWNSIADLGIQDLTGVILSITPTDDEPRAGTTVTITVDVQNNDLPVTFIGSPAAGDVRGGLVTVTYFLIDGDSDLIDCEFRYSTDGINYPLATEGGGDGTMGLSSSPDGIEHVFLWDSDMDLPETDGETITFRITPSDPQNPGATFTSKPFLINNNAEPSVTIASPTAGSIQEGTVLVDYTTIDTEQDSVGIQVWYSANGGFDFFTATPDLADPSHDGVTGLSTIPGLNNHIFAWATPLDLLGLNEEVVLRIVASDHPNPLLGDGPAAQTSVFTVDNTVAPHAIVDRVVSSTGRIAPPQEVFGSSTIEYRIVDPESDLASISVKYWVGVSPPVDVNTWLDAALDPSIGDGERNLSTLPGSGAMHTIGWQTALDLPGYNTAVHVAVIAQDTKIDADPFSGRIGPIIVNNTPVTATGDVATGILYDRVTMRYRLADANEDPADIVVRYSTGGVFGPFFAATESEGTPSEGRIALLTDSAGAEHIFVWNSFADLGKGDFIDVILEVAPTEVPTASPGSSAFTSSFRLDNRVITTVSGAGNGDGGDASDAWIAASIRGCAVDNFGNIFFSEEQKHRVRRIDAFTGQIETVLGNGAQASTGDGGPGTQASLNSPAGISFDSDNNLHVATRGGRRIRRVDSITKIVTTVAGGGLSNPGNGGLATDAVLTGPLDVVIRSNGEMFICEWLANRVRIVDTSGIINFYAGLAAAGDTGDGGPATAALLDSPRGLALHPVTEDLYIGDSDNHKIRWVDASAGDIIDTFAGTGVQGDTGDGGLATAAQLNNPVGLDFDAIGQLYVVTELAHRVRIINLGGNIDAFAGTGTAGFLGDGGLAVSARLNRPWDLAVDMGGEVHIADGNNFRIRTVDALGDIRTTAGQGFPFAVDNIPAVTEVLQWVEDVEVDSVGNIYHVHQNRVRRVDAQTGIITRAAGSGARGWSDGFPARNVLMCAPLGLAVDAAGLVYVADTGNHRVRLVDPVANTIVTFAGGAGGFGPICNSDGAFAGDGSLAVDAELNYPAGLAFDSAGNLYIADRDNHRIRIVDTLGNINTFAGDGTQSFGGDGLPATMAQLDSPLDVEVSGTGMVYIADTGNHRIRVVDTLGNIDTFAGDGVQGFGGDGDAATAASLDSPGGVAIDPTTGNIFISDTNNHRIRSVDLLTGTNIIVTVAGLGGASFAGDGGPPAQALIHLPKGIWIDSNGVVFFADWGNDRIRRF